MTAPTPRPPSGRARLSRTGIIVFVLLAYGLAWLACLPAWLDGGITSPWFSIGATLMMFSPTVAALLVLWLVERRPWRSRDEPTRDEPTQDGPTQDGSPPEADPAAPAARRTVGIPRMLGLVPGRRVGRFLGWLAIGWGLTILFVAGGYLTSAALGVWTPDLTGFSALQAVLAAKGVHPRDGLLPMIAVQQLVLGVTALAVGNSLATIGEEIGWRGLLYPALLDRWPWPLALVGGGVIWGLWHAPVILLGYNYGGSPVGLLMMCGFTTLAGAMLMWLRLRSGSVWPAVLGHAVVNGLSSAILIALGSVDDPPDTVLGTPLGVGGWIVPLALAVVVWTVLGHPRATDAGPAAATDRAGGEVTAGRRPGRGAG